MTSDALMKAILSMDSYNRGYDRGINLETVLNTTKIGNATIKIQSEIDENSDGRNIGFYALAYEWDHDNNADTDPQTIISYRGTDYPQEGTTRDIWNGWGMGAGNTNSPQGLMAIQFYNEVTGDLADPRDADVSLTGHSLWGGLAGYVGANDNYRFKRLAA